MEISQVRAPELAAWALSRGRPALTTDEAAELLGVPADQVRRRLHAPAVRGEWTNPGQGLWIPVPPQYRLWGAPPGIDTVDLILRHLRVGYYVGWLSAAAMYGAAHQAPQVFQVAVDRRVRDRQVGRTRFQFHIRRGLSEVPTRTHVTATGYAQVSTVAATALDVMTDVSVAGGIHNAATVVLELSEREDFSIDELVSAAKTYPIASARRLGWILENFAGVTGLEALAALSADGSANPSRLNPVNTLRGPIDRRWNISVNDEIEDES